MVVEGKVVVCPQCGKKFKLKAGFTAKSFACPSCSATVWVEGKPSAAPKGRRSKAGARRRGRTPTKARAPVGGRRGRRPEPAADEGEEHGRRRYQKPDNKSLHLILTVVGVVGCIGVGIFLFSTQKDKDANKEAAKTAKTTSGETGVDTGNLGSVGAPAKTDGGNTRPDIPVAGADTPKEGGTEPEAADDTGDAGKEDDGSASEEPTRKLGDSNRSSGSRRRNWAPPADLPHLEDTPAELRTQIDELIELMMDTMAGRDSLDAKQKLVAIGKPAFPRILGAMAKIRDTITDSDSMDERLIESSLKLADGALREMDGYLDSYNKGLIRPGTDKRYIEYILKLHYRRWVRDLSTMSEMPGPYDPSKVYESEADEDAKSGPK